ncbi:ATP-binding cassette domain-containing protein [Burkholderia sp. Bp8963]|uniref:ATP-binding cassette domain-containing protein n=1 Tax=Burkholderia sp. Bp8963 TaxID=2184547 RepID=UPI00163A45C1|nr:ATP-binding cassette domain-containing protein [Burkholderia sp. Bp8963]
MKTGSTPLMQAPDPDDLQLVDALADTDARGAPEDTALHVRRLSVELPGGPLRVSNWRVGHGDKVAVIGRNGVGKTSLTEAILGLRAGAHTDGTMLHAPLRDWHRKPALRRRLGVQLQRVFFPGRPRIGELVALHRKLYRTTSDRVIDALGIGALSSRLYELLSRGETQRVDLFLALAHEPAMLFLDEPFTGLDPNYAAQLSALLEDMRDTTLVMCCHTPTELALSTHTAWLSRNGFVRHERTDALRRALIGDYRLAVHCRTPDGARRLGGELRQRAPLDGTPRVEHAVVTVASARQEVELARALLGHSDVLRVEMGQSDLNDLLRYCAEEH